MKDLTIAVVGATGAVGTEFFRIMEQRYPALPKFKALASSRSAGKQLRVGKQELVVEETTEESFAGVDIAFISVSGEISRRLAPAAVAAGAVVIDDSSAFRMDENVPLVVPEVNGADVEWHQGIISIPNCSTTPLVMAASPLHDVNPVVRIVADTYQSVSGAGAAAVDELRAQSADVLESRPAAPHAFPHQIAFNVLPHVESFLDNGYTSEEMKMVNETRKILDLPELAVSATCVRVPVEVSHSEAVHIEFARPVNTDEVRETLSDAPGVRVLDDPQSNVYPMPLDAEGVDDVLVGRIRQDESHPHGIALWVVGDNLRKGAALNGIQIAEEVLSRELLPAHRGA